MILAQNIYGLPIVPLLLVVLGSLLFGLSGGCLNNALELRYDSRLDITRIFNLGFISYSVNLLRLNENILS
jgi:hypothetical protein